MNARHRLFHFLLASATAGLIALAGTANVHARDTDIYLKTPAIERDDVPNVLLIIDTSGSMATEVTSSRIPYDATIDYCSGDLNTLLAATVSNANSGKPSNCADISGRIYWDNPDNQGRTEPPAMNSERWFTATKNKCLDSTTAFNNAGYYSGSKIARWKDKDWKALKDKKDEDVTYVDCEADGTANGLVSGDNQFPSKKNNESYTGTANDEFNWNNFDQDAQPTLYSANYMSYWNNSALTATQSRLEIAQAAVKGIIDANKNVRFGLMVFNRNNNNDDDNDSSKRHGGRVIMRVDTMTDARRTTMKSKVDELTANGSTPLAETLWEARRYLGGLSVHYGDNDPDATPTRDTSAESGGNYVSPYLYGCQKTYIVYVTDGGPTRDNNADADINDLVNPDCTGNCLDELAGWMHNNDIYADVSGNQTVITYTVGFGTGLSSDAVTLLTNTATNGGGTYYTATTTDQLVSALQGALTSIVQSDTSFTTPSVSVNAFNRLFNRDDVYFALFKPSSTVRWDGNVKKFRLCNTQDVADNKCEFGEIIDKNRAVAMDINNVIKSTAVSYWSTAADGKNVTAGGAGTHITVPRTSSVLKTCYRSSYSGLSSSSRCTATNEDVTIEATTGNAVYDAAMTDPTILGLAANESSSVGNLINWIRGQDSFDSDGDSDTTEARSWNFADPLHSAPVAITFGGTNSDPIIKLFVATNDGIIRIINDNTGVEEWAFIPKELLSSQNALRLNADGDHVYGADMTPTFWIKDIDNDGIIEYSDGDRVYMYIGMRRGGRNIYAFDMTPSSVINSHGDTLSPKLMWVIQGGSGDFARLGQTWSRPKVARIRFACTGTECDDGDPNTDDSASRVVLVFGGGYDTNQDNSIAPGADDEGNAVYIVDPLTGARLWWASNTTNSDTDRADLELSGMKYSIPSEVTLVDANGDGAADRLYVGDTGGQIWRIDFDDQIGSNSDASKGYVFADLGCDGGSRSDNCSATSNQNRRKFFYPPDVAKINDPNFSDSANYDLVTIGSGNREDPIDLLTTNLSPVQVAVHNRIYAIRDYNYKFGPPTDANGNFAAPAVLTDNTTGGNLYDATANKLGTLTGQSLEDEITIFKASDGFFIDLKESTAIAELPNGLTNQVWVGEKVLARTLIFDGVLYVTTYVPANDTTAVQTCSAAEGAARYYAINVLTGAPSFNLDNSADGSEDRFVLIGGGIPSDPVIVVREGGASGLVGGSGGAGTMKVPSGTHRYRTYWYDE